MKKLLAALLALALGVSVLCACGSDGKGGQGGDNSGVTDDNGGQEEETGGLSEHLKTNLSAGGYVIDKIGDFSVYENTDAYRVVTTAEELVSAIVDAKYHYTYEWDDDTQTYTQGPASGYTEDNFEGTVHVIEIANDLDLGYKKLSSVVTGSGVVDNFAPNMDKWTDYLYNYGGIFESGISQIKVENTSNLLIYSKEGVKLTHCGFKLTSDTNVVFRNLEFDEMWQWEDAPTNATANIGDYDWYGWAYFKIAFCGYIWIDHCTFGKSYDGQIDYSNPDYTANAGVAFRAPYGADGGNGLHISWCSFNAGSDDEDGYIYKMMSEIEEDYQSGGSKALYYNALRDGGATFEEILYGLAIPQKKGFLCGDSGDDYNFNLKLQVSFANCTFKNLEDRLPKVRGGNAYMYNCVVDNSQYFGYRALLKAKNAASLVSAVKSSWKCALVSQGIVCGNGASVMAENCIYRGIETLLKNNDSNTAELVKGGYNIVNCSYQTSSTATPYIGSSSDNNNAFTNSSTSILSTENFAWHTADGKQPFTPLVTALDELEEYLTESVNGCGARSGLQIELLKSVY